MHCSNLTDLFYDIKMENECANFITVRSPLTAYVCDALQNAQSIYTCSTTVNQLVSLHQMTFLQVSSSSVVVFQFPVQNKGLRSMNRVA